LSEIKREKEREIISFSTNKNNKNNKKYNNTNIIIQIKKNKFWDI